jgi:hypothetical protein
MLQNDELYRLIQSEHIHEAFEMLKNVSYILLKTPFELLFRC